MNYDFMEFSFSGDRLIVTSNGSEVVIVYSETDTSFEGMLVPGGIWELQGKFGDFKLLDISIGQEWEYNAVVYSLEEILDDRVVLRVLSGRSTKKPVNVSYSIFFEKFRLKEEIDDDPSYTDGFRAGNTGLRWL